MENNNKEIIKTSEEVNAQTSFSWDTVKNFFKSDKIKNQALLKRGGYSVAITVIVLAGLIAVNWLMGLLTERLNLTIDMSENKVNTISEKNIKFLKSVDSDVTITVFSEKESYADYMAYVAGYYYGIEVVSEEDPQYKCFEQTISLLEKYDNYSDHIEIKYLNPESTEFGAITSKYSPSEYSYSYGSILVEGEVNGSERQKFLNLEDIYATQSDYYSSSITGSMLETSLTSAIDYVLGADIKKVAVITGHSSSYDAYQELLYINNYEVTDFNDTVVTDIPSEYDLVVISAPTTDFAKEEIDALSAFLENDGKLGKGLIYFADAYCPYLPNLSSFLKQWGIEVQEGIVFEGSDYYYVNTPTTMLVGIAELEEGDTLLDGFNSQIPAVIGSVVPMNKCETSSEIDVNDVMLTTGYSVVAPQGSSDTWSDYTEDDFQQLSAVIQSKKTRYDNSIEDVNQREQSSYVYAFSSVEFVQSEFATSDSYNVCNQEIVMACTNRAAHKRNGYTFESKAITGESFYDEVREKDVKSIGTLYMWILPLSVIAAGVVIFIVRRKSV